MLSYAKLISGVVFWILPFSLLLPPTLPMSVGRVVAIAQAIAGLILYFSSIILKIRKWKKWKKKGTIILGFVVYNLVFVPVCLLAYALESFVLTLVSVNIYGLPTDIF